MKKSLLILSSLLIFLVACDTGERDVTIPAGGNFDMVLSSNGILHIYGSGRLLASIQSTVVSRRKLEALFFAGYTKFEKEYVWQKESLSLHSETERVIWNNGTEMKYDGYGNLLRLTFSSSSGNSLKLNFVCQPEDHFMGFGAQTFKTDQRGEYIPIWTEEEGIHKIMEGDTNPLWMLVGNRHNSYYPVPYFYNPRGYALLVSTSRLTEFDLCRGLGNSWSIEADGNRLTILIMASPTPVDAIKMYTDITGKPILPQKWYFSPWNDAIGGEEAVIHTAELLRDNKIPSSVIWTEDWGGMAKREGDTYSFVYNWDVGRDLYPNFETMVTTLHHMGFFFLVYFNSFIDSRSRVRDTIPASYFIRREDGSPYMMIIPTLNMGTLLDLSNSHAREWAANKMKEAISRGVNGWMADYGEWLPYDSLTRCGSGATCHNLYPLQWHSLNLEVMEKYAPAGQFVFFGRSGYIGDQALTPVYWPGDQSTDFSIDDGLPTAVATAINVGWSGTVMFGSDIAGYMSMGNPPSDKELFLRWTEFGAFSPVMRTHHGYMAFANWNFHRDAETLQWYRYYAIWHQRLFPYLYSEAVSSGRDGIPLIRHMYMEFRDPNTLPLQYQYMLGPYLLVAPVVTRGERERLVYFPAGKWYNFWDGSSFTSKGQWINVPAPLTTIPVFARSGAIIELIAADIDTIEAPGDSMGITTLEDRNDWRELRIFSGTPSTWRDYEGTVFRNHLLHLPDPSKLTLNGEPLPGCSNNQPPCMSIEPEGIKVTVRSDSEEIRISDGEDNYLSIETPVNRWWQITLY